MTTPTTPLPTAAHDRGSAGPVPPGAAPAAGVTRPSGPGRTLTIVGGAVAGLVVLQLGLQGLAELSASTTSSTEQLDAAPVVELVTDGHVAVTTTTGDRVDVERTTRAAWITPESSSERTGDRLVVRHTCGWRVVGTCTTSLTVSVPEGTELVVRTSDADVRAEGALAGADLRTSSGGILATGVRGDVLAHASDGDVRVTGTQGAVDARSSSGRVEVVDAGGEVAARTSDGDVVVRQAGGAVTAQSSSGHVEVDGADGTTSARTSDGDVVVADADGDVTAISSSGHVTVHGTGRPVALTISTSSGRQTVEAPTDPAASRSVTIRTSDGDVAYLGPRG